MNSIERNILPDLLGLTRGPKLDNSRFYMGNLVSFLLNGGETGGRFALVDAAGRVGNEPPPHVHAWENEIFYILEGSAEFFIEGQAESLSAKAGDLVFLPQGQAHGLLFRSDYFRTLIMVQATGEHPVGLDGFFRDISEPARSMDLPEEADTYSTGDPEQAFQAALRNGVQMLSPDETALRLPGYVAARR